MSRLSNKSPVNIQQNQMDFKKPKTVLQESNDFGASSKKNPSPVERRGKSSKALKRNATIEKAQQEVAPKPLEKKELYIGKDDKLEGGIYMWDIKAIRKKRVKEEKQKE